MRSKKHRGFTLIELVVVMVIMGILATVVLISVNGARESARYTETKATMQQMAKAAQNYYVDKGYYPNDYPATTGYNDGWTQLKPYANFIGQAPKDGWDKVMDWNNWCGTLREVKEVEKYPGRGFEVTGTCIPDSDQDPGQVSIVSSSIKEIVYGIRGVATGPSDVWE